MVEQDFDHSIAVNLVLEDAIEKMDVLFKEGMKHRDVGELILQLEVSVKAGKVTKKDGTKVAEDTEEYKTFMASEMADVEKWAVVNADEFYDMVG
jgi:hypothetical protein